MSELEQSTFTIRRKDRAEAPKTILREGLRIGRLPESDIWLNHPTVSRLHAGINQIEGYFYLINLSASSATTLNGRAIPFNEAEALIDGDEIQIGPYFLHIEQTHETLGITVALEVGVNVGERELINKLETYKKQLADERRISGPLEGPTGPLTVQQKSKRQTGKLTEVTNALKVFWGKRTREKAGRLSPLHPQTPPRLGKVRFNWTPTRDLVRPWPLAIFIWAFIVVAALSALAVFADKGAFAPESISEAHMRESFTLDPAIAKQPNAGSCSSCHVIGVSVSNKQKLNANCAACHKTEAFVGTITRAHRDAGLTCTACHAEHRGANFTPMNAALESCAKCHDDQNKNLYNGKSVHTAHGGTYGYPVKNGVWIWSGFDVEELTEKPDVENFLKKNRVNSSQTQEWRNAQFHAVHLNRVRAADGIDGIADEDGTTKILSCGSCHKTGYMGTNVDREYPRTTCGKCHNSQVFNERSSSTVTSPTPSCTSCHVQHVKDKRWASTLLNSSNSRIGYR